MVYRNQIGVYNRYAEKGIWKEATLDTQSGRVEVAKAGELKLNQMKLVHAGGRRIVIGKSEGGYLAFDDRCPHKGGDGRDGVRRAGDDADADCGGAVRQEVGNRK